jgi:hypothetical protein
MVYLESKGSSAKIQMLGLFIYLINIFMRIKELLAEKTIAAPTASQCQVKRLSNVRYSQCVARGLKSHDSEHTDGTGTQGVKGSGRHLRGRKVKSTKYGGSLKYYPGSRE